MAIAGTRRWRTAKRNSGVGRVYAGSVNYFGLRQLDIFFLVSTLIAFGFLGKTVEDKLDNPGILL